mmetsp:Transcript_3957/g.9635  ORF Transcript_3957/g.9635 Transcript_3957/m.9635 type:complete len:309 (-) Transcript_3957:401-1327(-)
MSQVIATLFDKVFGMRISDEFLVPFLRLVELSRLECSCRGCQDALIAGTSWGRCACREVLPNFSTPVPAPSTSRRDIRAMVTNLQTAGVSLDAKPIALRSFEAARALATAITRAQGGAARHRIQNGGFAEIIVATFRFNDNSEISREGEAAVAVRTGTAHIATTLGLGGQPSVYELTMSWEGASVLMGSQCLGAEASLNFEPRGSVGRQLPRGRGFDLGFLLDLHSVSSDLLLRLHDMHLQPGSDWIKFVKGHGLVSKAGKRPVSLDDGLLCVLLVRDVPEFDLMSARPACSVHAMNLDAPRHMTLGH